MQDFRNYSYTIQIDKLEDTAREIIKAGYSVMMIINGESYDVTTDDSRTGDTRNR